MARGAGLAAALAPACTAKPAGFPLGWGAAFPLALGAATDFFGGTKSLGIHFSSHISRVKYSFPSNTWPKPQTPRALFAHTTSTLEKHGSDGVPGGGGDFARGGTLQGGGRVLVHA